MAALISAPIAAGVFGGVTASGTDFLVAAFRQAGLDVEAATTGQGLISDPIDKVTTFFTVYLILGDGQPLQGSLPAGRAGVVLEEGPPPDAPTRTSSAALPSFLGVPGPSPFHRLNPLTKLVLAGVSTALAIVLGGGRRTVLLLATVAVLVPRPSLAGILGRLLRTALLLSLPIAISVLVVNLFFFPAGREVLFQIGPIPPRPRASASRWRRWPGSPPSAAPSPSST